MNYNEENLQELTSPSMKVIIINSDWMLGPPGSHMKCSYYTPLLYRTMIHWLHVIILTTGPIICNKAEPWQPSDTE